MSTVPHPEIVSREEWLAGRKELLSQEKELTKHRDSVNAVRRRLPMVKVEKEYTFEGASGRKSLLDLFESYRQLIVYHFMFDPEWDEGCPGCTSLVDALGDLSMLQKRDTNFVLISRAPLAKLTAYKKKRGWNRPWFSSFNTDFNYDFHVTLDKSKAPLQYNYRTEDELRARSGKEPWFLQGESHGMSSFFRLDRDVFHSYSTFARGCENLTNSYALLDITPYGRQEEFEESPEGWPQRPTYGE